MTRTPPPTSRTLAMLALALTFAVRGLGQPLPGVVDVRDHGAAADGVTDDSAAVASALAALPPGGGLVCLPRGTILLASPVLIAKDGVTLAGFGEYATTVRTVGNSAFVLGESTPGSGTLRNLTIRDMGIYDASGATTTTAIDGIAALERSRLAHLRLHSFGAHEVRLRGGFHIVIEDCFFSHYQIGSEGGALLVTEHAQHGSTRALSLMRNYFADNAAGAGPTVLLRNVDGLTAFGNVFEDPPPDSGGPALRCEATPGFRARGHTFVNTHFEHHQWSEWQMHDVTAVTVLGGRLRPQFTWDQVPPGRERRWFEANAGSAGVTRGLGQIVVSSSGSAAHDPDAAARLAPLLPDGAAHDAISSGTALVHRQSYRAFWARTTAGAPVEIARSGVLQGGGSSVAPESRWRVSLGAQDQASRAVKLEVTGGKGDLVVYGGSTEVDAPGRGIILVSASGRARMRLGIDNNGELALTDLSEPGPTWFIRGDTGNGDLLVDLSDVIVLLRFLFLGGQAPVPMEGGDANADADVDLLDPIYLLAYLFLGGAPPPPPFPDPGAAPAP